VQVLSESQITAASTSPGSLSTHGTLRPEPDGKAPRSISRSWYEPVADDRLGNPDTDTGQPTHHIRLEGSNFDPDVTVKLR